MRILSPPSAGFNTVAAALSRLNASPLFREEIFPTVWKEAIRHSVDPVGAVAQSAKETAYGKFGGRIDHRWFNTAGIKLRDPLMVPGATRENTELPLCHAIFPSWTMGARAQVQHLVAYAGGLVYADEVVDPRYVWVAERYRCEHFSDLGRKWAPAADYGVRIEEIMARLSQ